MVCVEEMGESIDRYDLDGLNDLLLRMLSAKKEREREREIGSREEDRRCICCVGMRC